MESEVPFICKKKKTCGYYFEANWDAPLGSDDWPGFAAYAILMIQFYTPIIYKLMYEGPHTFPSIRQD